MGRKAARRVQWGKMHKRMNSAEFFSEQPYAAETWDAARRMEHRPRRSGRQGRRSNRNSKRRKKKNVYNRTAARKQNVKHEVYKTIQRKDTRRKYRYSHGNRYNRRTNFDNSRFDYG